jgi:polygalacturonase
MGARLFLLLAAASMLDAATCNTRDFGGSIQKAIDACAGGGTVVVASGQYHTGSISLRSNLELHLEAGAVILGSGDPKDYPLRKSVWGGAEEISPLIYGEDLENVSITGPGTIDGQGAVWWKREWMRSGKNRTAKGATPAELAEVEKIRHGRPQMIRLVRCRNVRIEGVRLVNAAGWTIHPLLCEYLNVRGVTITNQVPSPNTDGINPESCRWVHISDCHIDVGDDCITLKSGKDEAGRTMGRPDEDITITNCTMKQGHGGVTIGSEMSGGVRNVAVSNCVFHGTEKGIRIKSQRGRGGVVEGISISNIVMQDVLEAINITTFYSGSDKPGDIFPVGPGTPLFRDIRISNITARGSTTAGQITGLKEMPIEGVVLENVRIASKQGFTVRNAKGIVFRDVEILPESGAPVTTDNAEVSVTGRK